MVGLVSAVTASLFWAFASILFKHTGKDEFPLKLNFLKGIVALALLIITAIIINADFAIERKELFLLAVSGIIGIGIGDTAYFYALKIIGAQQTLLIATLAPGVTIILGAIFLSETITLLIFFSILLSIFGIILVVTDSIKNWKLLSLPGYLWALGAMFSQAIGILLSRLAIKATPTPPITSAIIRLFFGIVCILVIIAIQKHDLRKYNFNSKNNWLLFLFAVFIGTYITMWLQQISLKFVDAGIAQTLLSTSPIFIAIIYWLQGQKLKIQTSIGILITVIGVFMLFLIE